MANVGNNLFGNSSNQNNGSNGSLFGNNNTNNKTQSIFGNDNSNNNNNSFSLFSNSNNNEKSLNNNNSNSLFGNNNFGLFGQNNNNQTSLFGQNNESIPNDNISISASKNTNSIFLLGSDDKPNISQKYTTIQQINIYGNITNDNLKNIINENNVKKPKSLSQILSEKMNENKELNYLSYNSEYIQEKQDDEEKKI